MAKTKRERLTGRELQAIELMISTNMTQVEIAKEIGVCDETVHRWTKKSLFQAKLEEENKKRFHGLAVEAQKEMERLAFKGKQEQIRLQACKDILDRAGYKPKDEIDLGGIDIKIDYGD
ncbi:MAG: hypothetical protein HFE75_08740 [Firmicutes bacterium]|jgi:transposase-like protein|nr:hypothetical protein [Bacillota bacterium]